MLNTTALYKNAEFQSAMVRLGIWLFSVIYVFVGVVSQRYDVDTHNFFFLFLFYFLFFIALLLSVLIRPVWEERRYVSLMVDVSATTVCIYFTGEASSPFFIIYIWIFISYGTRYGRLHLNFASIMSVLMYSVVVTMMGQWGEYFFEASFILVALGALPIYQRSLMHQLQMARIDAERSGGMVERFLSNMTNEMRGPLVDILGSSKDLSISGLNMEQLDKVDDINSSASFLDSSIGDVLDFYKLETGTIQFQAAPFNVQDLIAEVSSSFVKTAQIRHIELVCSVSPGVPEIVVGDEQRLKQVLTNLVKSAFSICMGNELCISVQIDSSNYEMLLFELMGDAPLASSEEIGVGDEFAVEDEIMGVSEDSPDLGDRFASRLIYLMGGKFEVGPREEGVIFSFRVPVETNDFEAELVSELSMLQGKKAFVFEPNETSREEIIACCLEQGMSVEAVGKVADLSDSISGLRESQDVDIVIIADSPSGRDIERIVDICLDVLGDDLPLVVLAYRRNCLNLRKYSSAVLLRKPFIHNQLADAMQHVLVSSRL